MKRFFLLLFSLVFLIFPQVAHADEGWEIENFHADIAIQESGKIRIVETISVDFGYQTKHGIYRFIPYLYRNKQGETYTDVTIESVLQNNKKATYKLSQDNGHKQLKIGDKDKTIMGKNVYTITYIVTGVLRGFPEYDELYWNVTGNKWGVPIQKAEAVVTMPVSGITNSVCYEGPAGSRESCSLEVPSSQLATFATTKSLSSGEGLTIAVNYKKGLIPLVTVPKPKTFLEKFLAPTSLLTVTVSAVVGIGLVWLLWYHKGRDYWFSGTLFAPEGEKGKPKPVGAHETVTVEFTPPEKLRPAEMGVLKDERADTLDVVATLIDLATRGYLTITEVPKKWLFGSVDYLFTKTTPKHTRKSLPLLSYEQLLLDKLFEGRNSTKMSTLKKTFYDELEAVKKALYKEVVAKGFFLESPESVRTKYITIGVLSVIGSVVVTGVAIATESVRLADIAVAGILTAISLLASATSMPRKTAYGRELLRRSRGYYLFIDGAETYRQRFFEKKNMFNEVMPYAIVFGLTKKFAKQMHEMGIEPKQSDWYVSSQPLRSAAFVSSMNSFSQSMSTAIASTPSSSGSSSGGSSGGGFGGGGGGSW